MPHFTSFHTIISDEGYLELSLCSALTLQKLLCHHLVKVRLWTPFDGAYVVCNLPQFHFSLAGCLTKKRPSECITAGVFLIGMFVNSWFLLFNNARRWRRITLQLWFRCVFKLLRGYLSKEMGIVFSSCQNCIYAYNQHIKFKHYHYYFHISILLLLVLKVHICISVTTPVFASLNACISKAWLNRLVVYGAII